MKHLNSIMLLAVLMSAGCNDSSLFGLRTHTSASEAQTVQEDHYSILLSVHKDPTNHIQNANYYKKVLTKKVGWRGVFVIHKGGHSEVFWGRYRSWNDRKAKANLKTAKAYRTANGIAVFGKARIVPLPGKDAGPTKWNLNNVAESAYYSLLVAVFRDEPKRKYIGRRRLAVNYCRRLRKGGYEAYFHHGPVVSHVTIGAFGSRSVTIRKSSRGETMKINDPAIKSLRKDFEFLALNGRSVDEVIRDKRTGKEIRVARKKTYLIRVPGKSRPEDELYRERRNLPWQRHR